MRPQIGLCRGLGIGSCVSPEVEDIFSLHQTVFTREVNSSLPSNVGFTEINVPQGLQIKNRKIEALDSWDQVLASFRINTVNIHKAMLIQGPVESVFGRGPGGGMGKGRDGERDGRPSQSRSRRSFR